MNNCFSFKIITIRENGNILKWDSGENLASFLFAHEHRFPQMLMLQK